MALFVALLAVNAGEHYGLESRPAVGSFLNEVLPEVAPVQTSDWAVVPAFPHLLFTNLVGVLPVPGTSLLCAWEREGRVWTFENDPEVTQKTLALDISEQCQGWDDSGLLGLAFHPGFETNGYVFLCYTWVLPGTVVGSPLTRPAEYSPGTYHKRLSRFTLVDGVASPASELVLVDQTGDSAWHDGGGIFFHPDNGFLYWTVGDDNRFATQDISSKLFSGVFRIDVDMRGGEISHPIPRQPEQGVTAHYYIPDDNPFVGQEGVLEEFFCLGLRNPHRMTIDPPTGRIFIGDVGHASREEIDIIEPGEGGLNFQWNKIEGLNGDLTPPYIGINRRPVLDYPHDGGNAVIGGYVYRGSKFAEELGGKYIFGDNVNRNIWIMDESTTPATKTVIGVLPKGAGPNSGSDYTGLSSFGLDADGEIYMCQMSSEGGQIYTLAKAGPLPASRPLPKLLSETGVFTDLATLTPNAGLIPYTVNSPLWSDSAIKTRWLAVPSDTTVSFSPTGEWSFPDGTVFVKHFELATNETEPSLHKRLETRVLVRDTNGVVYGASYKWRADNSDADLVDTLTDEEIEITTATGTRTQVWSYPGRLDCLKCHTQPSGGVLGVNTRQLNGSFAYPATGVTDNQIRALNHIGLFNVAINEADIPDYDRLVTVTNTSATLEQRVRSYLDANCAQCHRPNGGVLAAFDARYDTPLSYQNIINGPVLNDLGISGTKLVVPEDTEKSMLFRRVSDVGDVKMPPLGKNKTDDSALAVLAAWINSLAEQDDGPPPLWKDLDIGGVLLPGRVSYDDGKYTVIGGGADIWYNSDAFHYVYQGMLTGDGSITARVVSLENTDPWAKAGVMIRETVDADSTHAYMLLSPGNGTAFQYRTETGSSSDTAEQLAVTAPGWVRLVRSGNVFSGYFSDNGEDWTLAGSTTIAMSNQVTVGLAVTAHNNMLLNTSIFDNVTVTRANPLRPQLFSPVDTDGMFQFKLVGEDSLSYVIEASSDLENWIPISTNKPADNLLQVVDEDAFSHPARFYRVRELK